MSIRDCNQCTGITKGGARCSRRTCMISNVCWQHLQSTLGLKVANSNLAGAGKGLFTLREIKRRPGDDRSRDVFIIEYKGERLTRAEVENRYQGHVGEYVLCPDAAHCIDASSTQSTVARYVNGCDKPGSRVRCNARFGRRANKWGILATRSIAAGSEIVCAYGPEYWNAAR